MLGSDGFNPVAKKLDYVVKEDATRKDFFAFSYSLVPACHVCCHNYEAAASARTGKHRIGLLRKLSGLINSPLCIAIFPLTHMRSHRVIDEASLKVAAVKTSRNCERPAQHHQAAGADR